MKEDRIPCVVPFCRRTAPKEKFEGQEIICGKHWRLADRFLRRRYSRLHRLLKRAEDDARGERIYRLVTRMWERARTQAIERAAGISA